MGFPDRYYGMTNGEFAADLFAFHANRTLHSNRRQYEAADVLFPAIDCLKDNPDKTESTK